MILKVPPTKANLFRLESELKFVTEGHDLLDRKREVLILELMQIIHDIKNLQKRLSDKLGAAYGTFCDAYVEMGSEEIERANYAYLEPLDVSVHERSVMGVPLPELRASHTPRPVQIGTFGTTPSFDAAVRQFSDAMPLLLEYAQANLTLARLATEIQKTQRRVNALETIFMPNTSETIKHIRDVLEESDREDFFRRKQVKRQHGRDEGRSETQ
ncbi:V-type ATP synthase subunit D [bacterium]|nr:V-type ATP synthase subunit D [bacterium]